MTVTNESKEPHRIENIGRDLLDQYGCSCGWRSRTYYDGAEYAIQDWRRHVQEETGAAPEWPYRAVESNT